MAGDGPSARSGERCNASDAPGSEGLEPERRIRAAGQPNVGVRHGHMTYGRETLPSRSCPPHGGIAARRVSDACGGDGNNRRDLADGDQ
jgi:hypothetical protein